MVAATHPGHDGGAEAAGAQVRHDGTRHDAVEPGPSRLKGWRSARLWWTQGLQACGLGDHSLPPAFCYGARVRKSGSTPILERPAQTAARPGQGRDGYPNGSLLDFFHRPW
jgi:hypothetical protein